MGRKEAGPPPRLFVRRPLDLGRAPRLVATGGRLTMRLLVPGPQLGVNHRWQRAAVRRPLAPPGSAAAQSCCSRGIPALVHLAEGVVVPAMPARRHRQAQPECAKNGESLSIVGRTSLGMSFSLNIG